jgi:hypothetical protein
MRFTVFTVVSSSLIIAGLGCSGGNQDYKKTTELKKAPANHEHHEHGAEGPHGGSLVEFEGDEHHGEVVLDHDAHALRVFILGGDAKSAAAIAATEATVTVGEKSYTLKAAAQDGDGEGKASKFELIDDAATHALLDEGAIHGKLSIKIGDKTITGGIDYHLHDVHHEHKDEKPADPAKAEPAKPDAPATTEPATEDKKPE